MKFFLSLAILCSASLFSSDLMSAATDPITMQTQRASKRDRSAYESCASIGDPTDTEDPAGTRRTKKQKCLKSYLLHLSDSSLKEAWRHGKSPREIEAWESLRTKLLQLAKRYSESGMITILHTLFETEKDFCKLRLILKLIHLLHLEQTITDEEYECTRNSLFNALCCDIPQARNQVVQLVTDESDDTEEESVLQLIINESDDTEEEYECARHFLSQSFRSVAHQEPATTRFEAIRCPVDEIEEYACTRHSRFQADRNAEPVAHGAYVKDSVDEIDEEVASINANFLRATTISPQSSNSIVPMTI